MYKIHVATNVDQGDVRFYFIDNIITKFLNNSNKRPHVHGKLLFS